MIQTWKKHLKMTEPSKMENEERWLSELPTEVKDWSKDDVRLWAVKEARVEADKADILLQQNINGASLLLLKQSDLLDLLTLGPTKLIIHARDELLKQKKEQTLNSNQHGRPCKPYPFHQYHDAYRYIVKSVLNIPESGASDYIQPCHEYKAYIHTEQLPLENKMRKFTDEVIRFAAACMNSRTNGTIHFGIGDKPEFEHGLVLGVDVHDKEEYENALKLAIKGHFEHKHLEAATKCIKPPRFVEVLNLNTTSAKKYVIEVDIVPDHLICEENIYHVYSLSTRTKGKHKEMKEQSKQFFVREGSSSRDLLALTTGAKPEKEFKGFVDGVRQLAQVRKQAEENHLSEVKKKVQGSRLIQMITGGSQSLDKTHFQHYVIVANKSHPVQLESLDFLSELNPIAVLDFDPESAQNGLKKHFEDQIAINVHLPVCYEITGAIEDIVSKLKLTKHTSWVFCNGGVDEEMPSDIDVWSMKKGASVRQVISFLCRKDVLPPKKFLVVFLLLSTVGDKMDPLLDTFGAFFQQLGGPEQILFICENKKTFIYWRDLIEACYGCDISARCIYELSFTEINGTVLNLRSNNRKSKRFLPGAGGSKVLLEKKKECSLDTLNVLCVNQCEGGNEDRATLEEKFYKGGKVSWWNFYFSEQAGSIPFIKRDKFEYILNTVIPSLSSLRKACVSFNLCHVPGCGGTTLAMHTLWALKDKFRCAVLKNNNADISEVAHQVIDLLMHGTTDQSGLLPVLLMIDDFEEMDDVYRLQTHIDKECMKRNVRARSPQVFLLNCMRAESLEEKGTTEESVFIGNKLSKTEQSQFEDKLKVIENQHQNPETFYGFMIMKKNFSPEYIQGIARNTLKNFNNEDKNAQLVAVLVLLNAYCSDATLAFSLCEEFLGLPTQPYCGFRTVEDGFGKFSPLLTVCTVEDTVRYKAVRMIHSSLSVQCLQELTSTYVTKVEITNLLLNTDKFYECIQGKTRLSKNVTQMLVKRDHKKGADSQFSPLIQEIEKQTPGDGETVLLNAAKRFEKDAVISQLVARYYYLKKRDFGEAKDWARKAKDLSGDNSYIFDTFSQVIKHELKNELENNKDSIITSDNLRKYLKMAFLATEAFRETHEIAKKEATLRVQNREDNRCFNTVGCLGEIQVAVIILDILNRTPFSKDHVCSGLLSEFLSGKVQKTTNLESYGRLHFEYKHYFQILKDFDNLLYNLKCRMKKNLDFLDSFYVILGSRFTVKDHREERNRQELFKCFQQYVNFFCKKDAEGMMETPNMKNMHQVLQERQFLEMNKADTHCGILDCLSRSDMHGDMMEKIVSAYHILNKISKRNVEERVNCIYANVVLSCIKSHSQSLVNYNEMRQGLCQVLQGQIPSKDNLALHFIAVALLWPKQIPVAKSAESAKLASYISQMKTSYYKKMKSVYNGKRPLVHFFLGKKQGYYSLIHRGEIEKCASKGQENFASLWENGKLWKTEEVKQLLYRVTGEVKRNAILADTCHTDLKIEVIPMFKSQISGLNPRTKVSFFIGFSFNGPLAIDIE